MYYCKSYDELEFTDDFMFSKIMRDEEICKGVVECLLGFKVGRIEFMTTQHQIENNPMNKGIRLDVYLEDSDKVIDLEIQTQIRNDEGLRMRYYQSMIDVDHLGKGQNYKELKESYIVFICLDDAVGSGLPVYSFDTCCREDRSVVLNDRIHKVIYNASKFEDATNPNVRSFLSYLANHASSDPLTDKIQTAVEFSRQKHPWRTEYMLWIDQVALWKDDAREEGLAEGREVGLQMGRAEGRIEGRSEGRAEGRIEGRAPFVKYLISEGKTPEEILKISGMSTEEFNSILEIIK